MADLYEELKTSFNSDDEGHQCTCCESIKTVYMSAHLPCAIMDMLCQLETLDKDSVLCESTLYLCIESLGQMCAKWAGRDHSHRHIPNAELTWEEHVAYKLDDFCRLMWNSRHLIATDAHGDEGSLVDPTQLVKPPLRPFVTATVAQMLAVRSLHIQKLPASESYVGHVLLHCWAYSTGKDRMDHFALPALHSIFIGHDLQTVLPLIQQAVSLCSDEFKYCLLQKISTSLRAKAYTHPETLFLICQSLFAHDVQIVERLGRKLPEGTGMIASLLICARRLLSLPQTAKSDWRVGICLAALGSLLRFEEPNTDVYWTQQVGSESFTLCSVMHNWIALLAHTIVRHVDGGVEFPHLARFVELQFMIANSLTGSDSELDSTLRSDSARVWHDTLKALRAVEPRDPHHGEEKQDTIDMWLSYGELFGLEEGVDTATGCELSVTSDHTRLWKIPRVCFYGPCPCATHGATHSFRVCKGCWRVLYCGKDCQKSDWAMGHRDVCDGSRTTSPRI
ncbi:hypothetical protein BXZ70DRAFT_359393 [Cristinia sonorae]|uniref:MYND-type domain-containing protein n=1 Tax=Cristinia sonorae TaxID=1940300 RepID=A0A8K0UJ73_9AGAR|nr:hypothetical protein BXZ70DRAFT_359393 [Cristinia sonorae]